MKAEERHELREQDASGRMIGLWLFFRDKGSYLLLILALGFLGYRLWVMYEQKQESARRSAWIQLRQAQMSENSFKELSDIVDNADVAKDVRAQAWLSLGIVNNLMVISPEEMAQHKLTRDTALEEAFKDYSEALKLQGNDLLIGGRAHLGLAAVLEDQGKWEDARKEYELLTKTSPFAGTPIADLAAERLKTLDDRRTAPRLASMMPPPAPVTPALPGTFLPGGGSTPMSPLPGFTPGGSTTTPSLPGLFNPIAPSTAPATSPFPITPIVPIGPMQTPLIPDFLPPPAPGTAPASQPVPETPK